MKGSMTTAKEIQSARKAGLLLCGKEYDGSLQWLGTKLQWTAFYAYMEL